MTLTARGGFPRRGTLASTAAILSLALCLLASAEPPRPGAVGGPTPATLDPQERSRTGDEPDFGRRPQPWRIERDLLSEGSQEALLEIPFVAPSLGGIESLVTRPAATSHASIAPEERAEMGIHEDLIRVSCGIEGERDLVADFNQALA